MKYKTEVGPEHVLMGWVVRDMDGRTPYRSLRGKDCCGEVVPSGNSEDGAKLNKRWMR